MVDLKRLCDDLRVASIQFNGRSGSVLLSNLLDGSDQIISCPPDSLTGVILRSLAIMTRDYSREDWPEIITKMAPNLIKHDEDINKDIGVPLDVFKDTLKKILQKTLPEDHTMDVYQLVGHVFRVIHISYAISNGDDLTEKKLILWQQHMPMDTEKARNAVKCLKNLTTITCIRHPIITIDSHFWHVITQQGHELTNKQIQLLANSYLNSLGQYNFQDGIRHIAVKFEDMHTNTEKLMKSLANELCIDYCEKMLETTLDKKIYYFKAARGVITGTNPNITQLNKLKCLTSIDVILLKKMLQKVADFYKYDLDDIVDSGKNDHILYGSDESLRRSSEAFVTAGRLKDYPKLIEV